MNDLDLCLEVVQGHVNHCGVAPMSPKLLELETSNLVHIFVWEMLSGRTNILATALLLVG